MLPRAGLRGRRPAVLANVARASAGLKRSPSKAGIQHKHTQPRVQKPLRQDHGGVHGPGRGGGGGGLRRRWFRGRLHHGLERYGQEPAVPQQRQPDLYRRRRSRGCGQRQRRQRTPRPTRSGSTSTTTASPTCSWCGSARTSCTRIWATASSRKITKAGRARALRQRHHGHRLRLRPRRLPGPVRGQLFPAGEPVSTRIPRASSRRASRRRRTAAE